MKQPTQNNAYLTPEVWQAFVQPMGKPKIRLGIFNSHADALLKAKKSAEHLTRRFGEDELDYYGAARILPEQASATNETGSN